MSIVNDYEDGLQGFVPDEAADRGFESYLLDHGGYASAADAMADYGLFGAGEGKLVLPYLATMEYFPDSLPGGHQKRGSCVAWSTRNAALVSYCAYIKWGKNEERFALPKVSATAIKNGVASTEGIYWYRAKASDGWQCSSAAQVAIEKCGLLLRQKYEDVGLDLTEYDVNLEGRWGASPPPEPIQRLCRQHLCSSATVAKGYQQVRDMLASGYALSTCGMEAFVDRRDSFGVCDRNHMKSWAHAMAATAVDDRPETVQKYGCGLILIQNSWPASYLSGPDAVVGTNHRIPQSAFWARWTDVQNRYFVALGPSKGWPANKLPNWGLGDIV
jgi:hypothetical protein